jgi:hypothetical protein
MKNRCIRSIDQIVHVSPASRSVVGERGGERTEHTNGNGRLEELSSFAVHSHLARDCWVWLSNEFRTYLKNTLARLPSKTFYGGQAKAQRKQRKHFLLELVFVAHFAVPPYESRR